MFYRRQTEEQSLGQTTLVRRKSFRLNCFLSGIDSFVEGLCIQPRLSHLSRKNEKFRIFFNKKNQLLFIGQEINNKHID